ncbi:DUF2059 domain-containing protein [Dyella solisilvae]|nr:DUF2059 domain-containing protein [Dyella solisilvae]
MKCRFLLLLMLAVLMSPAWGTEAPPSDESIHQLLDVMQSRKLLDGMAAQMNGMMLKSAEQANNGAPLAPEEQKIVNRGVEKLADLVKQQIAWPQMEPMMLDIYRKTFTQKEVDDLVAFYKSPSGQAVIQKMPQVLQQTMAMTQAKMQTMLPQMRQISADMVKELKGYREAHPTPDTQSAP